MSPRVLDILAVALFFGGFAGLGFLALRPESDRDVTMGVSWLVWASAPLCLGLCVAAVPWIVKLHGGPSAADAHMRSEVERLERGSHVIAAAMATALRESLTVAHPLRRHGHLAVPLFPIALFGALLTIQEVNRAFAGPYEEVQCAVTRSAC